jgi:hypothetical protein
MATYTLTKIAKWETEPLAVKMRGSVYRKILVEIQLRFQDGPCPFNMSDVAYILEEVWRGRSAISGGFERVTLTRWRLDQEFKTGNLYMSNTKGISLQCRGESKNYMPT